ncbi:MAG: hypothetical protein II933_01760 [Candidatus Methanomethylophilaceae archaeon]|nr:hypothetical protein [Candidatus Methanomethylophilaceae archaeon]
MRFEKTSSSRGFSLNSVILSSSSTLAMPNSQGFSTGVSAMVMSASVERWVSISALTSMSANTSPLAATNTSSSLGSASFIAPAVPRGSSS